MIRKKPMTRRAAIKLTTIGFLAAVLTGCSSEDLGRLLSSEKRGTDNMATHIVDALDAQNKEALISLFSHKALEAAADIEKGANYLFGHYKGESIAITDKGHNTSDYFGANRRVKKISAHYVVTTTQDVYHMLFILYLINEEDPAMEGLFSLDLFSDSEMNAEGFAISRDSMPGIYYPGRGEPQQQTPEQ